MNEPAAWEAARSLLAERLRSRAEFWRLKARDALSPSIDQCLIRADEADSCADVAACLSATYAAPPEPDMAAAKASRRDRK